MGDNNDVNASLVSDEGGAGGEDGASLIPGGFHVEGFDISTREGIQGVE